MKPVQNTLAGPARNGLIHLPPALLVVTLGNPRQECRHVGICRVELWQGGRHFMPDGKNCLARFASLNVRESLLKCIFLRSFLSGAARARYFEGSFEIQEPYCLSPEVAAALGLLPFCILPGEYALRETPLGPEAFFRIRRCARQSPGM